MIMVRFELGRESQFARRNKSLSDRKIVKKRWTTVVLSILNAVTLTNGLVFKGHVQE